MQDLAKQQISIGSDSFLRLLPTIRSIIYSILYLFALTFILLISCGNSESMLYLLNGSLHFANPKPIILSRSVGYTPNHLRPTYCRLIVWTRVSNIGGWSHQGICYYKYLYPSITIFYLNKSLCLDDQ